MRARGIPRQFRRVQVRRSHSEPLIQVADLVAGAILRRDARGESGVYEMIEARLKRVVEYGG